MRAKLLIQILLFLLAFTILFYTIYFYNIKNVNEIPKAKSIQKKNTFDRSIESNKKDNENSKSNIIENVVYENYDSEGNKYKITAKIGQFENLNSTKIFMDGVNAVIYLQNSNLITISSNEAIFDNQNFQTTFSKNVELNYLDHNIKADNLQLLFDKNLINIQNQIIYKNLGTELFADRIVIDLITKNSKIFMNNNSDTIKIVSIN